MRLLFLTPQLPYPPYQGTSLRNYNLIAGLAERHQIDLISFAAAGQQLTGHNPLLSICKSVATVAQPVRTRFQRIADTLRQPLPDMALRLLHPEMTYQVRRVLLANDYDIVQVEGIEMAPYALAAQSLNLDKPAAIVFDDHNCEYLLQKRNALTDLQHPLRLPAAIYSIIQWQKLARYERRVCTAMTHVLAVSKPDAEALLALNPALAVTVVPNGIDLDYYASVRTYRAASLAPSRIVFIGKMDYRPNVDAVLWFANQVLPILVGAGIDVHFDVVGMNPHPRLQVLSRMPNVTIVGGVEDVRPYLKQASVYVIPMRVGGGTRFKALEAMAAQIPVVSTQLGVEGIDVQDDQHLLIGNTPDQFAAQVQRLMYEGNNSTTLRARLVQSSFEFVSKNYSWSRILPLLDDLYMRIQ